MKRSIGFGVFAKYVSLNIMGMIGLSCYILADTFFVAQGLGADGLAALNLAIPIYNFIHGCGLMIGIGGGTKYSIFKSRGMNNEADRAFSHSVYLAAALSVLFVFAGLFLSENITALFGAGKTISDMTNTYLKVILLFSPAFLMNNILLCFVRNDGAPQLSMAAMLAGSMSNIVLDWFFIFPCRMGIFGAVLATGFAPVISMMVLSIHFFRKKNTFRPARCAPEPQIFSGILSNGIPSLITEVSSGIVIIIFNAVILKLEGSIGVAAYGVIANISLVVMAIFTGIAQGIQPLLSRCFGLGSKSDADAVFKYALIAALAVSAAVYGAVWLWAEEIADIFNSENSTALRSIAAEGLRLYFTAAPFAGFNILVSMYFTSSEHPRPAQAVSLLRGFALIIPLTFLLSHIWQMRGTWCAFPAAEFITSAVALVLFIGTAIYKSRIRA